MVYKCCVPNCRSNYNGCGSFTVFSFPKCEILKRKWIRAVPRKDFIPTKHSKVCELHFKEEDIRRTTEMYDEKTGKKVVAKLMQPRLENSAVPTVFPNCPTYLTVPGHSRESKEQKHLRIENTHIKIAISESIKSHQESYHMFNNFSEFLHCLSTFEVSTDWIIVNKGDIIIFISITLNSVPEISVSATFDQNLELKLFKGQIELKKFCNDTFPKKINNIKDLFSILNTFYSQNNTNSLSFDDLCISAVGLLKATKDLDETKQRKLTFLAEQLALLSFKKEKFRYSTELIIYLSLLYSISPHAYRYLRSTDIISIPHPKTIKKNCLKFNCNPQVEQFDHNFLLY